MPSLETGLWVEQSKSHPHMRVTATLESWANVIDALLIASHSRHVNASTFMAVADSLIMDILSVHTVVQSVQDNWHHYHNPDDAAASSSVISASQGPDALRSIIPITRAMVDDEAYTKPAAECSKHFRSPSTLCVCGHSLDYHRDSGNDFCQARCLCPKFTAPTNEQEIALSESRAH